MLLNQPIIELLFALNFPTQSLNRCIEFDYFLVFIHKLALQTLEFLQFHELCFLDRLSLALAIPFIPLHLANMVVQLFRLFSQHQALFAEHTFQSGFACLKPLDGELEVVIILLSAVVPDLGLVVLALELVVFQNILVDLFLEVPAFLFQTCLVVLQLFSYLGLLLQDMELLPKVTQLGFLHRLAVQFLL